MLSVDIDSSRYFADTIYGYNINRTGFPSRFPLILCRRSLSKERGFTACPPPLYTAFLAEMPAAAILKPRAVLLRRTGHDDGAHADCRDIFTATSDAQAIIARALIARAYRCHFSARSIHAIFNAWRSYGL